MDNFWMDFLINFMILIIYKIARKNFGCFTIKDNQAVKHLAMTGSKWQAVKWGLVWACLGVLLINCITICATINDIVFHFCRCWQVLIPQLQSKIRNYDESNHTICRCHRYAECTIWQAVIHQSNNQTAARAHDDLA